MLGAERALARSVTSIRVSSIALLGSDFIVLICRLIGLGYSGASQSACKGSALPVLDILRADGFGIRPAGFWVSGGF